MPFNGNSNEEYSVKYPDAVYEGIKRSKMMVMVRSGREESEYTDNKYIVMYNSETGSSTADGSSWVTMTPDEARDLATQLVMLANKAEEE